MTDFNSEGSAVFNLDSHKQLNAEITMLNASEYWNCSADMTEQTHSDGDTIVLKQVGIQESPIRLLIAFIIFVENTVVAVALILSWSKLRQNLYIFALSISICDGLLGLIHLMVGLLGTLLITADENGEMTVVKGMGPSSWFYTVRGGALLMAEIGSIGHAALIAVAFERYVVTLAPSRDDDKNGTTKGSSKSALLSRKTSYKLTAIVWAIAIVIGILPLTWNCGHECACYIEQGILGEDEDAMRCFKNNGCSYLFPPLMNNVNIIAVSVFFVMMLVMVVASIKVMLAAGGLKALLPYSCHKKLMRQQKFKDQNFSDRQQTHRRLRSHSVQMSYMRNMMHFMFILTFSSIVCRVPGNLLLLIESVTTHRLAIPVKHAQIIVIIGICNSLINPIIFATTLHGMRDALKKLVKPCCTQVVDVQIGKTIYSDSHDPKGQSMLDRPDQQENYQNAVHVHFQSDVEIEKSQQDEEAV